MMIRRHLLEDFCQNIQQQFSQHFEGSTCRMAHTCWYFVLSRHPKHLCNLRASWRQDALRQQELKKQRKGTVIPRWEPVRPLRGGFCIWKHDVDGWPNSGEMEKVFFSLIGVHHACMVGLGLKLAEGLDTELLRTHLESLCILPFTCRRSSGILTFDPPFGAPLEPAFKWPCHA